MTEPVHEAPDRPCIVAERVSLFRDERVLLTAVSFVVGRGTIHGFVGTNGAGVSTVFKMMASLIAPTMGFMKVCGLPVAKARIGLRTIVGYVPERSALYDALTVEENLGVFAGGFGYGGRVRRRRIDHALDFMALAAERHEECAALSKGMRRRVEVARALLHDPQVLILDEPAADLDPRTRAGLWERLRELRAHGKTIVLSSHILPEIQGLCDGLTVMHRRRVRYSGSLAEFVAESERLMTEHVYRVEAGRGTLGWERHFLDQEGVRILRSEPEPAVVTFACDRTTATAGLLRSLLAAGVEVRRFERERASLVGEYLRLTESAEPKGRP